MTVMEEGGLFPQHPREGNGESLEGEMLAPHILPTSEQDKNMGPDRLNQEVSTGSSWDSFIKPYEQMTRGGGNFAK